MNKCELFGHKTAPTRFVTTKKAIHFRHENGSATGERIAYFLLFATSVNYQKKEIRALADKGRFVIYLWCARRQTFDKLCREIRQTPDCEITF